MFKDFLSSIFAWENLFLLTIFFSILCYFHFNPFKLERIAADENLKHLIQK